MKIFSISIYFGRASLELEFRIIIIIQKLIYNKLTSDLKMDRSPGSSYLLNNSTSQTPQKTNYRLKKLQREVYNYRDTINEKNEQIKYLSQRNSQLMQGKSGKSSSSKKGSDNIYESSLQDQIARLNIKLGQKSKQYERLYQKYTTLQNDMVTLQDFATDLDRQRKFLADKLSNIQVHTQGDQVVGQLQNKLVLMSTEIMRLGQLNRNKTQQNNQLRFKLKQRDQQKQLIDSQLSQKQRIIIQYRQKIRNLQKRMHQNQSNKQYQNQSTYKILSLQIQRLNVQLHNKIQQIQALQYRNKILEQKHQSLHNSNVRNNNYGDLQIEVQRLNKINNSNKQQIIEMEQQIKRIRKDNNQMNQDNQKYRRFIKKLQSQLQQTRKNYIKDQNQKIRIQVETSEKTIREQRTLIEKMQQQVQVHNQQKQRQMKKSFEDQVYNLRLMLQQSQNKCSSLYTDLMKYQEKLVMLSQQVERLSLQNNKYQQEIVEWKRLQYKVQAKERQLKQIQRTKQQAIYQMKRDKQQIQRLKGQLKDLWTKNSDLQSKQFKLVSLGDQLQITNQRLQSKQRQYRILQQKYQQQVSLQTSSYRVQDLQSQLQSQRKSFRIKQQQASYNYQRQVQNMKDTIHKLQMKIRQLSSEQSSTQSNYILLADQIRRLNQVLSQSSQTIINQKRQISLLENNLQTTERSIEKMKSMYVSNQRVEQQVHKRMEIYNKQIRMHLEDNNNLKIKLQQLMSNSAMSEQEAHNLKLALQQAKNTLRMKEQQAKDMLQDMRTAKRSEDNLIMLIKQIKQSNMRLQRKLAQIEQDYIRRLQQKSNEKQNIQRQYIQYNRRVRQAESNSNDLKFQISSLKNRLQLLTKRQRQLQSQNERLQIRIDDEVRNKANNIKMTSQQYQDKIYQYQQQIKRNARYIGELQSEVKNKNDQLYKTQANVRQLEDQKFRLYNQNRDNQNDKRRQIQSKNMEYRISQQRRQQQLTNLRDQINSLKDQIRKKQRIIQDKGKLIFDYQNKLAMLSQELERINTIVYTKNNQIEILQQKIGKNQQNTSKQNKQTMQILTIQITRLNTTLCDSLQQIKELQLQILNKNRQIKRTAQLTKKNEQILKDKIFQLEQECQRTLLQNHKLSANVGVLTKRIQDFQKMEKQNQQLRSKMITLNSQKTKYKNTITDLESQISILKNSFENNLQQQQHSLSSKATIKMSQLQQAKRQIERKVTMLVSQNQQLVSQIQNLRRQLQASDQENSNNKKQLIRTKNQNVNLARQKQKYRLINEQVMIKVQKMTFNRTADIGDKQAYQFRVKHLQGVIKDYENQMNLLKQQLEKASQRQKSRQNSSVGSSNARMSSMSKPTGNTGDLQQKYNILETIHLKLKRQADGLRQKVTQYEFKMKKLKGQFDLINKLTHEYKDQNQYLRQQNHSQCVYVGKTMQNQAVSMPSSLANQPNITKNQDLLVKQTLASQIDRLGILNGNLRRQIQDLRVQAVDSQAIKSRYEELMATFVLMAVQLESIRQR